jgi:hypothetical protein
MPSYSIQKYSIQNLINFFAEKSGTQDNQVAEKLHIRFFKNYFEELKAKTIVIEYDYVDHDYLDDFVYYYVRSFKDYDRFCTRLHFFSFSFEEKDFEEGLIKEGDIVNNKSLQDNYLGFIVLKPLPKTYIGRTCLKTYPTNDVRFFPFSRNYDINLFGIPLSVKTIAFQEQDSVVAACASSAIWSAFQVTGKLFQHFIPTPVEITKSAIEAIPYSTRHFPNNGLNAEQMAQAIRSVGLDPYLVVKTHHDILKATVYAFQKAKIPLIMGMDLLEVNGQEKEMGKHAVVITGYSMGGDMKKFNNGNFFLKSSRINKLYVHDDQVGPFARMEFTSIDKQLSTSWTDQNNQIGNVIGKPNILIIPLYPKIRITFETILLTVSKLNSLINYLIENLNLEISNLNWDVFLSKSNDLKSEIYKSNALAKERKLSLLRSPLPKYIWRAVADYEDHKIEFIFDSTDIEQGNIFINYIAYSDELLNLFKLIAAHINHQTIKIKPLARILEALKSD